MQNVPYISVVQEIYDQNPAFKPTLHKFLKGFIANQNTQTDTNNDAMNYLRQMFAMRYPRRDNSPPAYKAIFDNFIALTKQNLANENYTLFLRYLSLYITGQLSHKMFISLIIPLLPQPVNPENTIIKELPKFMTAINSGVFYEARKTFKNNIDELAAELVISATAAKPSGEYSKSFAKCLTLLSNGCIRPQVAKQWLSTFAKPELIKRLDNIDDFSLFYPGRFPADIIFSESLQESLPPKNVFELYTDSIARRYDPHNLAAVSSDILELKMRQIRHLILSLAIGDPVTANSLSFVYGIDAAKEILGKLPNHTIPVVMRLVNLFEDCYKTLSSLMYHKMKQYKVDDPEYRIIYKRLLNHSTFAFYYELPGSRFIDFKSLHTAQVAIATINFFNELYFAGEEKDKIQKSLESLFPLFDPKNSGHYYVVNERPIHSIVYLSEVARILNLAGNLEEVNVLDDFTFAEEQKDFGMSLIDMLTAMTSEDSHLEGEMSVIDLPLVRVVRALHSFESFVLPEFPENVDQVNIYMTMTQTTTENSFGITCTSCFSPCFVDVQVDPGIMREEAQAPV